MKKPAIPSAPKDPSGFSNAVKENLEIITGRRGGNISKLDPATATTADLANKINEILTVLQG